MSGHGYLPKGIPTPQERTEYESLIAKRDGGERLTKAEEYIVKRYELLYTDLRNE